MHSLTSTELHGHVNVLDGCITPLDHADSLQQVRHQQAVDNEAGCVLGEIEMNIYERNQRFIFFEKKKESC